MTIQKIMITNGGPHPADKWADVTTDSIISLIQIPDDSVTPEAAQARQVKRDLTAKLFAIFNKHHGDHQKDEIDALNADPERLMAAHDPSDRVEAVMKEVNAVLSATPFAKHFAQDDVQTVIRNTIGQHLVDVAHIERSWHFDRNPDHPAAEAFRTVFRR